MDIDIDLDVDPFNGLFIYTFRAPFGVALVRRMTQHPTISVAPQALDTAESHSATGQ